LLVCSTEAAQIQRSYEEDHTGDYHFEQILRTQAQRSYTTCTLQHVKKSSACKSFYKSEVPEHTAQSELRRDDKDGKQTEWHSHVVNRQNDVCRGFDVQSAERLPCQSEEHQTTEDAGAFDPAFVALAEGPVF
jgi:hypothetical protein